MILKLFDKTKLIHNNIIIILKFSFIFIQFLLKKKNNKKFCDILYKYAELYNYCIYIKQYNKNNIPYNINVYETYDLLRCDKVIHYYFDSNNVHKLM